MLYRLIDDYDQYMTFFIEPKELRAKMGDDIKIYMGAAPDRYLDYWVKPDVTFYREDEYPQAFAIPDLTLWGEFLVLNGKAYDTLSSKLGSYGEFLPVNCEGITYYLLNVLTFAEDHNALNKAESEYYEMDGLRTGLKKITFKEEQLEGVLLFRAEYEGYGRIFCSSEFKQLVEALKLKGLKFRTELEGYN
jgi:hypothetical protein